MSGMPLDHKSFFISLWLETLLYGFHVVLFCFCLYILLRHKRPGYAVFLVTAVFIFAFSTTHIFIAFVGFMRCFHPHKTCTHEVNELRWPNVVSPKTFAYVMNAFFADALVVYRCYAIWNFDTYYILPAVVLVLVTAMVGVSVFEDSPKAIQPSPPFFVLSLITNLYTTAMAAGRLYYFLPAVRKYWGNTPDLQRRYSRAFIIILETGAFNSACFVIFLVVCQNKATEGAALLVLQCVAQIFVSSSLYR
ncbi:hypothetical protein L218DRAFT_294554 [Marasmius fiardii PR-910]|nr:hypothetical protein L218DRAFT_294554 [Marasmius fiardii PR-910]